MVCELLKQGNLSFILTSAILNMQPTTAASSVSFPQFSNEIQDFCLAGILYLFPLKKKKIVQLPTKATLFFVLMYFRLSFYLAGGRT